MSLRFAQIDAVISVALHKARMLRLEDPLASERDSISKGDYPGHPFRGNQYTRGKGGVGGGGSAGAATASPAPDKPKGSKRLRAFEEALAGARIRADQPNGSKRPKDRLEAMRERAVREHWVPSRRKEAERAAREAARGMAPYSSSKNPVLRPRFRANPGVYNQRLGLAQKQRNRVEKGDYPGHPFRGNQYTRVQGAGSGAIPPIKPGRGVDDPDPKYGGKSAREQFGDEAADAAIELAGKVREIEPGVTKDLMGVVEGVPGARLVGLEHRFKAEGSLARKIAQDSAADGVSVKQAATGVSDTIRYTAVIPSNQYAGGVATIVAQLREQGYEMPDSRIKNFWQRGDDYNGINAKFRHPNGTEIEIQFHTPGTMLAKKRTHPIYEESRVESDPIRRWNLQMQMVGMVDAINIPRGKTLDIGTLVNKPPQAPPGLNAAMANLG